MLCTDACKPFILCSLHQRNAPLGILRYVSSLGVHQCPFTATRGGLAWTCSHALPQDHRQAVGFPDGVRTRRQHVSARRARTGPPHFGHASTQLCVRPSERQTRTSARIPPRHPACARPPSEVYRMLHTQRCVRPPSEAHPPSESHPLVQTQQAHASSHSEAHGCAQHKHSAHPVVVAAERVILTRSARCSSAIRARGGSTTRCSTCGTGCRRR